MDIADAVACLVEAPDAVGNRLDEEIARLDLGDRHVDRGWLRIGRASHHEMRRTLVASFVANLLEEEIDKACDKARDKVWVVGAARVVLHM